MKNGVLAGLILVTLLACTGIVSANMIANGGFESPVISGSWVIMNSVPGWTLDDTEIEYQTQSTVGLTPYEGVQYAELDPNYNVRISQVISVKGGSTYDISFAQSCRAGDPHLPSYMGVYWGTTKLGQTTCTVVPGQSQAWATHTYTVTPASDADVKITFADEGVSDSFGVLLDDVKVEARQGPNLVPEFPTALVPVTFIAGVLGLVLLIRIKTE
jgi:Protein of unknown function (DUF642)